VQQIIGTLMAKMDTATAQNSNINHFMGSNNMKKSNCFKQQQWGKEEKCS
jgi:hypothetical protein